MAKDAGHLVGVLRGAGMALLVAGVLMVVATVLHPSRETATTIVATESRLVTAHVAYTLAWLLVLLGLPGLYAGSARRDGTAGIGGLPDSLLGHVPDCGDRELRFPRPGSGQGVTEP